MRFQVRLVSDHFNQQISDPNNQKRLIRCQFSNNHDLISIPISLHIRRTVTRDTIVTLFETNIPPRPVSKYKSGDPLRCQ
ncbi:hypothetical protein EUGRSUZ_E02572 [Eucalyptus grandis]|uniref:Uncharacterized protein n=2 Tax=Eucalyptus grandis TaxID=71139 RepID=A0ACC3KX56_EUCGR|nr:hypothetical protein EUGRSUZ_E02572 [Eucalyptus grandis]